MLSITVLKNSSLTDWRRVSGSRNAEKSKIEHEGLKNYFRDQCLINSQPTFPIFICFDSMKWLTIPKGHKPDKCESHYSLKFSFTNI